MADQQHADFAADFGLADTAGDDAIIQRLADMLPLDYERARKAEAEKLGIQRVSMLDRVVEAARANGGGADTKGQGRRLDLQLPEPWPHVVDGAALLSELEEYFARHLVLPARGAVLLALWVVHTYCFDLWRYTPRLHVAAPVKNSGKSRALALIRYVAARPLRVENVTPAAVFRTVEAAHPTLLIDEADQFLPQNAELVGILNGGHERGAQTIRAVAVADDFEPRAFNTFAPVAIAGIGRLPGTLESRCIPLPMQRARASEMPPDIDDGTEAHGGRLGRQAVRWVADHRAALAGARPDTGPLINRLRNNWQPLYAIAETAGDGWPALARAAAAALTASGDDDADSLGEQLLADVQAAFQALFEERVAARAPAPGDALELSSTALVARLVALEGRPWPEMGRSRAPLTTNRLARLLKPFGVYPVKIGDRDARVNGYKLDSFAEPFERHLLPLPSGTLA